MSKSGMYDARLFRVSAPQRPIIQQNSFEVNAPRFEVQDGGSGNCMPTVSATFSSDSITVKAMSTKDIGNVVLKFCDNTTQKFDNLSGTSVTLAGTGTNLKKCIIGVWIKSGCNSSNDGPGYGEFVQNKNVNANCCKTQNQCTFGVPNCHGTCDDQWVKDCAGNCVNINDTPQFLTDCAGQCYNVNDGPSNVLDCAGVCGPKSDPQNILDCKGNCFSSYDSPEYTIDCSGQCSPSASPDHFMSCDGQCISKDCQYEGPPIATVPKPSPKKPSFQAKAPAKKTVTFLAKNHY